MSQLVQSITNPKIEGHVRTAIDGVCPGCGKHATDLYMDRQQPRFRCAPCALKVAEREAEGCCVMSLLSDAPNLDDLRKLEASWLTPKTVERALTRLCETQNFPQRRRPKSGRQKGIHNDY